MENNDYLPINTHLLFDDKRDVAECIQCRNAVDYNPYEEEPFCSDKCEEKHHIEEHLSGKYGYHGEYL